ncbi:MAG: HAD family hydrolase [Candidatus Sulfotelmatobacter sp.]
MKKRRHSGDPAILFDLDGTLVDTVYEHVIAWSTTLASAGFTVPKWMLHRRIGMSGKSMLRQVLREQRQKSRRPNIEKLETEHDANFRRASRNPVLLPGAIDLLRFLDRHKVRWAIATTGNLPQTKRMLQKLKLPEPAVVVTGDDVRKAKPSPDVFVLAAEKLGLAIADCIVVGDSVWDMLAAGRKGALGVGLLSGGYSEAELEGAGAFRVYADAGEMLLHIEDLGIDR